MSMSTAGKKSKGAASAGVSDRPKKIGSWKVNPLFTEVGGCTQSCTDGDVPCCSRAILQGFFFALSSKAMHKYLPEIAAKGRAAIPAAGTTAAKKKAT